MWAVTAWLSDPPKGLVFIGVHSSLVTPELRVLRSCPHPLSQIPVPISCYLETAATLLSALYLVFLDLQLYLGFCRLHPSALRDPGHAVFVPVITVFLGFSALSCCSMSPS
jgi:hypothetical protein